LSDGIFDGRQSCNDALVPKISMTELTTMLDAYCWVRDLAILHGDIEINPN